MKKTEVLFPRRILIVKLSAIGDVIQTLPMVEALKEHFPDARIDWVVEEEASDLITGHPALERVIVSRRKSWQKQFLGKGIWRVTLREMRKFFRDLRSCEYDWIIDNHGILKSGLLVFLSRGKRKIGFQASPGIADEGNYLFTNERYPAPDIERHALDRYLNLVAQLGVPVNQRTLAFPVSAAARENGQKILADRNFLAHPLVVIHPLAQWATKNWPQENFARLADALVARGIGVVFTGSGQDREALEEIGKLLNSREKVLNLAGCTTLRELAGIFSLAELVLTTDTGPMHLAAAVQVPVVALFGPTAPWRTGPYGNGHMVIRKDLPCSPCFQKKCATRECMNTISVEEVLAAVEKRLRA
ncbi:MAG: lipopolysaccharide heptosyltransferase I [Deltaproteobacteria bacterium]|nr:lipopolysaccharide heptosyltransferase I [Deltaproteobacteria bacterium]